MDLIHHLLKMFLQVAEKVLGLLEGDLDYPSFQLELERLLNELGKEICREVMESADTWLRQNPKEREGGVVQRKDDEKGVLTPFGHMVFRRSYYHNEGIGGYAHLVDLAAGLQPHAKMDLSVKAKLVSAATEMSYRKAGKNIWSSGSSNCSVSGQTVTNTIRKTILDNAEADDESPKKKVRVLHIQADEDHVSKQSGGTALAKLVYTTSGYGVSSSKLE
mgnify:FL=1|jgi:hypothetical protein